MKTHGVRPSNNLLFLDEPFREHFLHQVYRHRHCTPSLVLENVWPDNLSCQYCSPHDNLGPVKWTFMQGWVSGQNQQFSFFLSSFLFKFLLQNAHYAPVHNSIARNFPRTVASSNKHHNFPQRTDFEKLRHHYINFKWLNLTLSRT